jgi:hypothetical protein
MLGTHVRVSHDSGFLVNDDFEEFGVTVNFMVGRTACFSGPIMCSCLFSSFMVLAMVTADWWRRSNGRVAERQRSAQRAA